MAAERGQRALCHDGPVTAVSKMVVASVGEKCIVLLCCSFIAKADEGSGQSQPMVLLRTMFQTPTAT